MQFLAATSKLWGINTIWIDWCHYCSRVFPYNVNTSRQSTLSKNKSVGIYLGNTWPLLFLKLQKEIECLHRWQISMEFQFGWKIPSVSFQMLTGHHHTKGFLKSKSFNCNLCTTTSPFAIDLISQCSVL